jgi:hypothetical protein
VVKAVYQRAPRTNAVVCSTLAMSLSPRSHQSFVAAFLVLSTLFASTTLLSSALNLRVKDYMADLLKNEHNLIERNVQVVALVNVDSALLPEEYPSWILKRPNEEVAAPKAGQQMPQRVL